MAELSSHPLDWAEEHPYITAGVVVGGVVILYWLFFSGSSSAGSTDTAQTNMAAAYYAAEAQQAVAGTNLNIATEQAQAQVQTAAIQAGGAVAINQANATASQNIAASMYAADTQDTATTATAATQQAGIWANAQQIGAAYAAQTQQVQANDSLAATQSSNAYAYQTAVSNNSANENIDWMNNVLPQEFNTYGGDGFITNLPGGGTFSTSIMGNVGLFQQMGYTRAQAEYLSGVYNLPQPGTVGGP